jgi:hypothetical protein
MRLYALHGLVIQSPLVLPAVVAPPGTPHTLRVSYELGAPAPPKQAGEVLASSDAALARYHASRGDYGLYCSYTELGDVLFRPDAQVVVRLVSDDNESAPALFSGSALAIWLVANAQLVLHASAVAWGDLAMAVVGASNSGKTTLAAQCVLAGAHLLGDDVLHVEMLGSSVRCHYGVQSLRLRSASSVLAEGWPGPVYRSTRDARLVLVAPSPSATVGGALDALVFPTLSEHADVVVERLGQAEALRRLLLAPRVRGLQAPALLREQMRLNAELARRVPSFMVAMPKGPPFLAEKANDVRLRIRELLGATKSV